MWSDPAFLDSDYNDGAAFRDFNGFYLKHWQSRLDAVADELFDPVAFRCRSVKFQPYDFAWNSGRTVPIALVGDAEKDFSP